MLAALEAVGLAHGRLQLAIGFSGGLDSTVLLHVACKLADELEASEPVAIHIHHGLQDAAEGWAHHCERFATGLGARFQLERVHIERRGGQSLEAVAHEVRMQVFAAIDADAVLLGHHRDDQVETVLFNALRGTGLAGLSGIPPVRALPGGRPLLRPFLGLPRSHLREYAMRHALTWVEDPSNADLDLARNRIRHDVMPVLRSLREGADSAMARSIAHLQTARDLLEMVTEQALEESRLPEGRLNLEVLFVQDEALAARIVRGWLKQHGAPTPPTKRLAEFLRQLRAAREPFAQMDLTDPASGETWRVLRERGFLKIAR